ncbi:MAG TPA: hypothetical protein VFS59_04320, partial [Gemmatimonadaceae bacterium]|nr:hypothetical protein [Gemmatimonadaceae bacterium]
EASGPSASASTIVRALAAAEGAPRVASAAERESALAVLGAWIARDWSRGSCGLSVADTPIRRRVLRALGGATAAAPRHRRTALLAHAAALRRALAAPLPLGAERELGALLDASGSHAEWIERALAIVERVPRRASAAGPASPPRVRALILIGPEVRAHQPTPPGEGGRCATFAERTSPHATGAR